MAIAGQGASQSLFITQLESSPGVPDLEHLPVLRTDMNTDGNGYDPIQRWDEHEPDGFNSPLGTALLAEEGTFGGNHMPNYGTIELDMPLLCGGAAPLVDTVLGGGDGRRQRVWMMPELGVREVLKTICAFYGYGDNGVELLYGKIQNWTIESTRSGQTNGNKVFHFNNVRRSQTVPGFALQDTIIQLTAAAAAGPISLALALQGGSAQSVSINPWDTVGTIEAAIAALSNVTGATVTKALTVNAQAFSFVATNPTGEYSIDDSANFAAGDSTASIQTKLQTLGGAFAGATVVGTSVAFVDDAQTVTFVNVPSPVNLGVQATGGSDFQNVADPTNNTEWQTAIAALTAFAGVTVAVTGAITLADSLLNGVLNISMVGVSEPLLKVVSGTVGNVTGTEAGTIDAVAVTPGESISSIQAALRGAGGHNAGVIVTGTSTSGTFSGFVISGLTTDAHGNNVSAYNGTYSAAGTYGGAPYYANVGATFFFYYSTSADQWCVSDTLGASGSSFTATINPILVSNDASTATPANAGMDNGAAWFTFDHGTDTNYSLTTGTIDSNAADPSLDLNLLYGPAAGNVVPTVVTLTYSQTTAQGTAISGEASAVVTPGVEGTLSLFIQLAPAVGAVSVPTFAGTNAALTIDHVYAATGTIDLQITNPANTPVFPHQNSGTGWTTSVTQMGSLGNGPAIPSTNGFIEPTHWLLFKASSASDLASIDMGNATTTVSPTESHLINTATAHMFSMESLVMPFYFEDQQVHAGGHADQKPKITASLTLPKDEDGWCEDIYSTDNGGGVGATPFYLRQAARSGQTEFWIDLYCARNAQPAHPVEDNVVMRQFPLTRYYNPAGSLIFTLTEPVS